jgi:prepilin-type N-terminal cleavage/methylation domain-containing protein
MRYLLKLKLRKQAGFTLIEVLIALAITAILGTGIATSVNQIININSSSVNRMQAIKQVENAQLYINYDAQMAQTIQTASGSGFPFTISFCDWDGLTHNITYSIITPVDGSPKYLQRSETIGAGQPNIKTVANFIDDATEKTNCSYSSSLKQLIVTITAKVGGYKSAAETRVLKIKLRPIQQE